MMIYTGKTQEDLIKEMGASRALDFLTSPQKHWVYNKDRNEIAGKNDTIVWLQDKDRWIDIWNYALNSDGTISIFGEYEILNDEDKPL